MPNLPDCINIFTPGSFPSTVGAAPITPILPSLCDAHSPYTFTIVDPCSVFTSLDFSKYYNSQYFGVF